jgi:TorA maturation chaperone TorD
MASTDSQKLQNLTAAADFFSIMSVMLDFLTLPEVYEGIKSGMLQRDIQAVVEEMEIVDPRISTALENLNTVHEQIAVNSYKYTQLRQEYTRLFNDPKHPAIGFYEGTFINRKYEDEGKAAPDNSSLFINQAALDADRQYKRAGVARDIAKQNIPGDCMLTEMAFMQHLLQLKVRAILDKNVERENEIDEWLYEFKRLHLKVWMYEFFEKCHTTSTQEYFHAVALLGQVLALETLRDIHSNTLGEDAQ